LLLLTSVAKIISATGGQKILQALDPVTHLYFRHEFIAVGFVEMAIALICFFSNKIVSSTLLMAWLATNFMVYRVGLVILGYHKPCTCLGNFTDRVHIPPETADTLMKIILAYLLLGSYASLFWLWRQRKTMAKTPSN
jgi:hypothetical protein